jgi:hypothetical protein
LVSYVSLSSAAPPGLWNFNITNLYLDAVYVFPKSNRDTGFPIVYPSARHFSRLVLPSPTYITYEALSGSPVTIFPVLTGLLSCSGEKLPFSFVLKDPPLSPSTLHPCGTGPFDTRGNMQSIQATYRPLNESRSEIRLLEILSNDGDDVVNTN